MPSITLRSIPKDALDHILKEQLYAKMELKLNQYSMEKTINKIILEHKALKEKNEKN